MPERFSVAPEEVAWRSADGQVVVIQLETGFYYSLDPTASVVWGMIARGASDLTTLEAEVCKAFDIQAGSSLAHLEELVARFLSECLLQEKEGAADTQHDEVKPSGPYRPPTFEKFDKLESLILCAE